MIRPIYVQPIDERRERLGVVCLCNYFRSFGIDLSNRKLGKLDRIDAELYDDCVRAYVEHKWRHPRNQHHATWFVSNDKIEEGFLRSETNGVPLFLEYMWGEDVWYARISRMDRVAILPGGRVDRGDPMDEEMMAHFPSAIFRFIGRISI